MITTILTDVEGTTSSIAFVKETLFPYATKHLRPFLAEHCERPDVEKAIAAVALDMGMKPTQLPEICNELLHWIEQDRKTTSLKTLQGLIWEEGYEKGHLQGHIYPDAAEGLKRWQAAGKKLYVYSSGSEAAQKMLFGHTEFGDLTTLFSGHFDTRAGHKWETASYRKILRELDVPAAEVLFLSDSLKELDAAREQGINTCCLIRESSVLEHCDHPIARSFDEVDKLF